LIRRIHEILPDRIVALSNLHCQSRRCLSLRRAGAGTKTVTGREAALPSV